ncbi:hypothetical protein DTO046C5_1552 [Penicillium roqueforti]|nr:hypothetical protein DTO046C5_1552 [Penicillium roqueforti]
MSDISPPLSQGVGYGVVIGVGLSFAAGMIFVTKALKSTVGEDNSNAETFIVANRRVSTGLVASAVVSSWLWSTALLSAVLVAYQYGVSGPFWYGAGCSPMIVCFAYLGTVCKKRVPSAHTVLEIIKMRYGTVAHLSFTFLAVVNNLFNTINMILGASVAITYLTGMHIMASTFLLPVGVVIYTLTGGIKATFLTDYIHTFIILILCCYLTTKALTSVEVKSIGGLYDLVIAAQPNHLVDGNYQGSLFTMTSQQGIFFGIILLVSNFGAVIMDTGYFTKAFAASPEGVVPGYVIGGLSYFSIPWALGTIMGMVALGLESTKAFPTYPRPMTSTEVTNGLALPYAAIAVAGKGGAVATLLMTFMAVTSTLSAQVIAVSSIVAFDGYRTYFNKNANNQEIIFWSRVGVIIFGLVAAGLTAMFHYVGIDMGWTLYMIGVITCPGIFPLILSILWRKQSRIAVIASAYLGLATGLAVWLGTAHHFYGAVTVSSTGQTLPCMYGTVASAVSPLLYSVLITLIAPEDFDWKSMSNNDLAIHSEGEVTEVTKERNETGQLSESSQRRWSRYALFWAVATFFGHWVLWPLPMYGARFIFSRGFFIAWVVLVDLFGEILGSEADNVPLDSSEDDGPLLRWKTDGRNKNGSGHLKRHGWLRGIYSLALEGRFPSDACEVIYGDSTTPAGSSEVQDLIHFQKLRDSLCAELDCQVCYALLLDPMTTPCGHTFCRKCVARVLNHTDLCPICRRKLGIPNDLQSEPINQPVARLVEYFFPDQISVRRETSAQDETGADYEKSLPLFVCTLSFPTMPTFLHVFEPRYRLMIQRVLASGNGKFGMVMHNRQGRVQPGQLHDAPFMQYGTLLMIERYELLPDGRSLVVATGVSRFKIVDSGMLDGYYVAKTERVDDISLAEEERLESLETSTGGVNALSEGNEADPPLGSMPTQQLLLSAREYITNQRRSGAPWLHPRVMLAYGPIPTDAARFPWWFASILPISEEEKYPLLAATSVRERLKLSAKWARQLEARDWSTRSSLYSVL